VGAERMNAYLHLLQDKRVALVVNQTSVVGSVHLVDTLQRKGVKIVKIFAPEHGFRGEAAAGEHIDNSIDQHSGLPIVSIYGNHRKPSPEQLKDVDVLVFDIQDVGSRFYTFISTMHYVMEAAAENSKQVIILDRPNPCDYIDGPVIRHDKFRSFVGMHSIPLLHGCTVGELAQMINGEGWLKNAVKCDLKVIAVEGWKHRQPYSLPIKPSPNLPNDQAIALYASLCLFEATEVSVGRGTFMPFQVIGFSDPKFGTFTFTPVAIAGMDTKPLQQDKKCYGLDLRKAKTPQGFSLKYFLHFYAIAGGSETFISRPDFFDKLAGTDELRKQIVAGLTEKQIRQTWKTDLEKYKKIRCKT
jgi:uncharacterized protein YbbC (DUF1343 family)